MALVDARTLSADEEITTDLCIIGGGPIGLSLAHAMRGSGLDVTLVETGGEARDEDAETLSGGETVGDKYAPLTMYRRRMLGGASTIWGGRCVPYDPIDFEARDYAPNTGWPFPASELTSHYARATELAQAGIAEYDADVALPDAKPLIDGLHSDILKANNLERFSLPTNFWSLLGKELGQAANMRLLLHATCTWLAVDDSGQNVQQAFFQTLAGGRFTVRARKFIVAAGGIETYRLLAASNDVHAAGLGNFHDVLGRYFMSHIEGNFVTLRLNDPKRKVHWGFDMVPNTLAGEAKDGSEADIYTRRRLSISPEAQRENGLLNMIVRLHHANAVNPMHHNAVLSAMFMAKNFILPEYRNKITMVERAAASSMPSGSAFWAGHMRNIILGSPRLAAFAYDWIRRRNLATRRIPYVVLPSFSGTYPLDFNSEQIPTPESRLTQTATTDRFGVPFVSVDWRMTETDVTSIARTFRLMKAELESSGVGTIDLGDGVLEDRVRTESVPIGGHHIGMARMHEDPRQGVVDADLKVHGVSNVYLASTAVLPTSSHANPTLTALALALRLAEKLKNTA